MKIDSWKYVRIMYSCKYILLRDTYTPVSIEHVGVVTASYRSAWQCCCVGLTGSTQGS